MARRVRLAATAMDLRVLRVALAALFMRDLNFEEQDCVERLKVRIDVLDRQVGDNVILDEGDPS